jgi:hypothetical protein
MKRVFGANKQPHQRLLQLEQDIIQFKANSCGRGINATSADLRTKYYLDFMKRNEKQATGDICERKVGMVHVCQFGYYS